MLIEIAEIEGEFLEVNTSSTLKEIGDKKHQVYMKVWEELIKRTQSKELSSILTQMKKGFKSQYKHSNLGS